MDIALVNGTPQIVGSTSFPFPLPERMAWSPLGDEIAFRRSSSEELVIMRVADGSLRSVYLGDGGGRNPSWSPDGQHLAFQEDDNIKILDIASGNVVTITAGRLPDWARTKNTLAYELEIAPQWNGFVHVIDLLPDGNGNFQPAGSPQQLVIGRQPSWSPDDSELAYLEEPSMRTIWVFTVSTGATRQITGGPTDRGPDWRR